MAVGFMFCYVTDECSVSLFLRLVTITKQLRSSWERVKTGRRIIEEKVLQNELRNFEKEVQCTFQGFNVLMG